MAYHGASHYGRGGELMAVRLNIEGLNRIADAARNVRTQYVADGVEYGIYQELGTRHMAAHPFMRPAVERIRPHIGLAIEEAGGMEHLDEAVRMMANQVWDDARLLAPFQYGKLRGSLHVQENEP